MHIPLRKIVVLVFILASVANLPAAPSPSAELQRALAAADRARATPKGREYHEAFNGAIKEVLIAGMRDCVPIHAPGVGGSPGFQCVLILGKDGKPKWIIRDSRDRMAQCFYAKLVKRTYPPPPADNWPVTFGVNLPSQ